MADKPATLPAGKPSKLMADKPATLPAGKPWAEIGKGWSANSSFHRGNPHFLRLPAVLLAGLFSVIKKLFSRRYQRAYNLSLIFSHCVVNLSTFILPKDLKNVFIKLVL